jgi:glycosyltransferase involved in cell wall biosynthesis
MALSSLPVSQSIHLPELDVNAENVAEIRTTVQYRPITATLAIAATVSVVIPARNEAANLPYVFKTLPSWIDEIVLVDGHSSDDTVAVTRELRPEAKIIAQSGSGKGDALMAGFARATGDIIVAIDADGSTDGAEIIHFVGALVAGADFAKGSRFSGTGRSDDITGVRRWGNRFLNMLVNRLFGTQFTDLCYGYNAFWARHLDALNIDCAGFEIEALMNIRAAKAGLRIHEIPSHERCRIFGTSNLRAIRDGWRILKLIMRERFGGAPRLRLAGLVRSRPSPVVSSVVADTADDCREGV